MVVGYVANSSEGRRVARCYPVGVRQLLPALAKAAQNDVAVKCTCH
jgi:hypothetical protein